MKKLFKIFLVVFAALGVLGVLAAGFIAYNIMQVDYKYTGEELFTAVNEHRKSVNAPQLILDPILCDNLVERWTAITSPGNAHKGFEEWLDSEGIGSNPKYGQIGELYVVDVSTPENAINFWKGSPGHKSTLEMQELAYGCSYANDGAGVLIVATKGQ